MKRTHKDGRKDLPKNKIPKERILTLKNGSKIFFKKAKARLLGIDQRTLKTVRR